MTQWYSHKVVLPSELSKTNTVRKGVDEAGEIGNQNVNAHALSAHVLGHDPKKPGYNVYQLTKEEYVLSAVQCLERRVGEAVCDTEDQDHGNRSIGARNVGVAC